jgi:hypothetical protein
MKINELVLFSAGFDFGSDLKYNARIIFVTGPLDLFWSGLWQVLQR